MGSGLFDAYRNLAVGQIANAPGTAGTSIVVGTGQGARFPTLPTGAAFQAVVYPAGFTPDPSNAEVVRVTAVSGDTLTVTRAQEGSTARNIAAGDIIANTLTAKMLDDLIAGNNPIGTAVTLTANSATADAIIANFTTAFPPNTIPANATYRVRVGFSSAATASNPTFRVRLGPNATTADPLLGTSTAGTGVANGHGVMEATIRVGSPNTTAYALFSGVCGATALGTAAAALAPATIAPGSALRLTVSASQSAAQALTPRWATLERVA